MEEAAIVSTDMHSGLAELTQIFSADLQAPYLGCHAQNRPRCLHLISSFVYMRRFSFEQPNRF